MYTVKRNKGKAVLTAKHYLKQKRSCLKSKAESKETRTHFVTATLIRDVVGAPFLRRKKKLKKE